ncbi:lipocalin-like domain-containing protein [Roseinatronobacter alkalisoli]|uniref:Lipocalin-like domain-containing protein n=1 Tax=Roseinatronobacter alkalisoli TaxID=3028235 RepID=A0ABT5TCL5_9RHOB|nr:lipocalin-like domain-containing protein [Roseinatronobacter sp. HJB301]MDD7972091.1 lipocalin-like domain-containing protein [Roseinatronobacter sp. HJB301]
MKPCLAAFATALLLTAAPAQAQGFAGLGTTAEDFSVPERGRELTFPQDHGAHPDFRIEWWYLTATLTGDDGQDYGAQWTLFRSALQPGEAAGFASPQVWMGHAGLTTADSHFAVETFGRGGTGQAGVTPDPFSAFIDDWHMTSRAGPDSDPYDRLHIHATGHDFSYDLTAQAQGPLVLHGDQGYSVKSQGGQASYYYSQPFYDITGTLHLPDGPVSVSGHGWLDREWSSQPLADDQAGWDWFSLGFDDGHRMMGFQLRGAQVFTSGTWIAPDGTATPLPPDALEFTPLGSARVAGRDVPVRWRIDWPEGGVSITTEPLNPHAWMDLSVSYWEGPLRFSGSHTGRGYLEMTGY